jgi:hypothetical protein
LFARNESESKNRREAILNKTLRDFDAAALCSADQRTRNRTSIDDVTASGYCAPIIRPRLARVSRQPLR